MKEVKAIVREDIFANLKRSKKKKVKILLCSTSFRIFKVAKVNVVGNHENQQINIGFILPKKIVKKSSTRNLIKRWGRELARRNLNTPIYCYPLEHYPGIILIVRRKVCILN